jgi:hypothetical protein
LGNNKPVQKLSTQLELGAIELKDPNSNKVLIILCLYIFKLTTP